MRLRLVALILVAAPAMAEHPWAEPAPAIVDPVPRFLMPEFRLSRIGSGLRLVEFDRSALYLGARYSSRRLLVGPPRRSGVELVLRWRIRL